VHLSSGDYVRDTAPGVWSYFDTAVAESIPFEHRGWQPVRKRILAAMKSEGVPVARAERFVACGEETFVYQEESTGEIEWHNSRCGDRFCMVCGAIRSKRISVALRPRLEKCQPMFITFTVRGLPSDRLSTLMDRLKEGWKQVRRLQLWKEKIRGGAVMTEIKWSKTSGGHWHPHMHILCDGDWIDQDRLRAAWFAITRDSDQVDVSRITDLGKALGYVTKYASKPMDSSFTMRPGLLREAMRVLKGQRLCACFGTWHGTPLNDSEEIVEDETDVLTNWRCKGTLRTLGYSAEQGDKAAAELICRVRALQELRYALLERQRSCSPNHSGARPPPDRTTGAIAGDVPAGGGLFDIQRVA
jgi:hypothetical protein